MFGVTFPPHLLVNALQCADAVQCAQLQHAGEGRPHVTAHLLLGPFLTQTEADENHVYG